MAKYTPPEQTRTMQVVDIIILLVPIFGALWAPLSAQAGPAHPKSWSKSTIRPGKASSRLPRRSNNGRSSAMPIAASAHDIIQNVYEYSVDWLQFVLMAAVLIGYFVFLFRASDKEYREVIAEKFGDKS